MPGGGPCSTDGGRKVGDLLLLHYSDRYVSGAFLVTRDLSHGGSCLGFIKGRERSTMEVVAWSETTWASRTDNPMLVTFMYLIALAGTFWVVFQQ